MTDTIKNDNSAEIKGKNTLRCTCTDKLLDARGSVRKYTLEFSDGNVIEANNKQVRELIKSGNVIFTNLKIGKGNKIVDCEDGDGNYILMSEKFFANNKQNIIDTFKDDTFDITENDSGKDMTLTFHGTKAYNINGNEYVIVIRLKVTNENKSCSIRFESKDSELRIGTYNMIVNDDIKTSVDLAQVLNKFVARINANRYYLDPDSDIELPTLEQCETLVKHNLAKFFNGFEFTVRKGKKDDGDTLLRIYESKESPVRIKVDKYRVRVVLSYNDGNKATGKIKMNLISPYSHNEYNVISNSINHAGIYKTFEAFINNSGEIM